ncbi:TetR/AcrR family transcriptional regulator [Microlunatus speluncae]|uniref:TetR/AcrR family transcriptional regulator n=1 Tax=Microlunatus speluncae TaxID=2594267 RepID=UPI001FEA80C2|nr:TetR/AcrR family transcriptional regulator [Microlunatus speluncae]
METVPVRERMLAASLTVLAAEGSAAVTARRLAAEVGVSTMAVYTHFGGMDGVWHSIVETGCRQLVAGFETVGESRDPVADVAAFGSVYVLRGLTEPEMYRAMFTDPRLSEYTDVLADEALDRLVEAVGRCAGGGRLDAMDRRAVEGLAYQLWLLWHGAVSLALVGMLKPKQVRQSVTDGMISAFAGHGDDRPRAGRSVRRGLRGLDAIEKAG